MSLLHTALLLAAQKDYPDDNVPGFIAVIVVCGAMVAFSAWVWWINFGPGAKDRVRGQAETRSERSEKTGRS